MSRLRFLVSDNDNLSGSLSPKLGDLPCLNALYLNGNRFSEEIRFAEEYYKRVGRRFASWDNPALCYSAGNGPVGWRSARVGKERFLVQRTR